MHSSILPEDQFDLIVLDVVMPALDGPQTLDLLRAQSVNRDTPAVFMTAHAHPSELGWLKAMDVVDVLPKNFNLKRLAGRAEVTGGAVSALKMERATESAHPCQSATARPCRNHAPPAMMAACPTSCTQLCFSKRKLHSAPRGSSAGGFPQRTPAFRKPPEQLTQRATLSSAARHSNTNIFYDHGHSPSRAHRPPLRCS